MPRRDPDYVRILKGKKPRLSPHEQIRFPITKAALEAPPDYLDEFGLAHWKRMVHILDQVQLFQAPSRDKLARYCQACADYEAIQEERKKLGRKERHKVTFQNWRQRSFWKQCLKEYEDVMQDFEREYGLTPASAAKVRHPSAVVKPSEKLVEFIDERPKLEV